MNNKLSASVPGHRYEADDKTMYDILVRFDSNDRIVAYRYEAITGKRVDNVVVDNIVPLKDGDTCSKYMGTAFNQTFTFWI